jgi:hypothetical protein
LGDSSGRRVAAERTVCFGIDTNPRALAILQEWVKTTGAEMNEARNAHDAHSQGRGTHPQQGVGGAWLLDRQCDRDGWCASIMQAMLDEVAPKLKIGVRMLSETVRADLAGEPQWRMTCISQNLI